MRLVAAALVAAAALATPAAAAPPDPSDYVTVERNPPVNCVRFPCLDQPPPYTVCVVPVALCTPR